MLRFCYIVATTALNCCFSRLAPPFCYFKKLTPSFKESPRPLLPNTLYSPKLPYFYLALPLALLLVFFLLPAGAAVFFSLWDTTHNLYAPQWAGLGQYSKLLAMPGFQQALANTALFVGVGVPLLVSLPLGMALLVARPGPFIESIRALLYLPVVVPMVVVGLSFKWLLQSDGLLNYGLSWLGLSAVPWLSSPQWALWAVLAVIVWKGLGYYMMMYVAHLQSLSPELYEAAELDGATGWYRHWHVSLPHLRPTMLMVALISTIGSLKTFTEIYVMTRGGPLHSTETLVYFLYRQAFERLDLGLACACGVVLTALLLGVSLLQLRLGQDVGFTSSVKKGVA